MTGLAAGCGRRQDGGDWPGRGLRHHEDGSETRITLRLRVRQFPAALFSSRLRQSTFIFLRLKTQPTSDFLRGSHPGRRSASFHRSIVPLYAATINLDVRQHHTPPVEGINQHTGWRLTIPKHRLARLNPLTGLPSTRPSQWLPPRQLAPLCQAPRCKSATTAS